MSQPEKPRGLVAVPPARLWPERLYQRYFPRFSSAILVGFLFAANWRLDPGSDSSLSAWLPNGIITWIIIAMSAWLFQSGHARMALSSDPLPPRSTSGWSRRFGWMQMMSGRQAIWAGVLFGIGIGLWYGLRYVQIEGLSIGLDAVLSNGLEFGLRSGLSVEELSCW